MAKQVNQPDNKKPEILRLHEAPATNIHWHETGQITELQIESIKDPAVAHHSIPVTSIPSPFARIHLVEDAFRKINQAASSDYNKLYGSTIYHKLISETFDIAELFFNFDEFRESGLHLDILQWRIQDKLSELKSRPEHRLLGDTLELFIKQSAEKSGLRNMEAIYIMRIGYKPIGGTSPSTLFFSTPNEGHFKTSQPIKIANDTLFDADFCPLYKREVGFVKQLYLFFEANTQLKALMPLMWKHLEITLNAIQNNNYNLWNEITQLQHSGQMQAMSKMQSDYIPATFAGAGTFVFLMPNVMLFKKRVGSDSISSDFMIGSFKNLNGVNEKSANAKTPLLLQNQFFMPLDYYGGKWDVNTTVPFQDKAALEDRTLPGLQRKHPYLTVSDFLEPYLMRLPYMLNAERYFNGNLQGFNTGNKHENIAPDSNFALPLTRRFFDFFDVEDLRRTLPSGEPVFRMIKVDEQTVKVELRLPIKANGMFITLQRNYRIGVVPKIDEMHNEGAIVDCTFNLGIMPFIRNVKNQRVTVLEREAHQAQPYQVSFYDQKNPEPLKIDFQKVRSDLSKGHQATSSYYDVDENFDYIHISKLNYSGVVIPLYPNHIEGGKTFTFSVDFGTTNSHIEYSVDGSVPHGFDINANDAQLITMQDPNWDITPREIQGYFLYEMIPSLVGASEFNFPSRTALAEIHDLSWGSGVMVYGDFNPAFYYQKYRSLPQADIHTNLKWGNMKAGDFAAEGRIKGFLESLLLLMRNKVLLNGGRLANTKIVWFYPSSMSHFNKSELANIWHELVKEYFGVPATQIHAYSESEAPYYVHADARPSTRPSVNIDIGGGTTDVCVFLNEKPAYHTSFRFAGNNLFGNGYMGEVGLQNGFVKTFSPIVKSFLDENYYQLISLTEVFEELSSGSTGRSSDLLSFFFSMEGNTQLKNNRLEFSFARILRQDQRFKITFLLFHGAILYHTAKWMKGLGLDMPQHIFYSGNGSKTVNSLDASPNWEMLSKIGKVIFEQVYETTYQDKYLETHTIPNPKEATCKGGIDLQRKTSDKSKSIQTSLLGSKEEILISEDSTESKFQRLCYKDILDNNELKNSVVEESKQFIDLIINLNNHLRLADIGIPLGKLDAYRQILFSSLDAYLQQGLNERLKATDAAQVLEESLFFYPLVGAIHRLTLDIAEGRV